MSIKKDFDLSQIGYSGANDEKIKIDFHLYENDIKNFCKKWDIETHKVLEHFEEYINDLNDLNKDYSFWTYLGLASALDVNDNKLNKTITELSLLSQPLSEMLLFTSRITKEIGYDKMMELSNMYPDFELSLKDTANGIKYTLSDKEELTAMVLSDAFSDDIYDQYHASLKFDFNGQELSYTELWAKRTSSDREERKLAFEILSKEFNDLKNKVIHANIYSIVCKTNAASIKLRGIENVMRSRNISENMEDSSVDKLMSKVAEKYPIYHEFLRLKSIFLGLDKLETYDVGAPADGNDVKCSYEEGCKLYLDTIKDVDADIYKHSLSLLENGRVDAMPKNNKSGGAFCSYNKKDGEWVLLNWDDTLSYTSTLAHELGHAFHGFMSRKQNNINYGSSLCMAETASIFNETILFDAILNKSENKASLIIDRLDDIFATILRQIAYVRFEKKCHQSWNDKNPLTWEDYDSIWLDEIKLLYGDSININDDMLKHVWMNIPHIFHTPFYCYAYAFGNILSLNVYESYKDSDDKNEYMNKFKEFLSLGGSKTPKDAVKDVFDIDIDSDHFYDTAFDYIQSLINILKNEIK